MTKVLVINGPNLNLQGVREESIYGRASLKDIEERLNTLCREKEVKLELFQSNHEGEIIDRIHQAIGQTDILIINPGALTHYSYSLRDALAAADMVKIEVHISNIYAREEWRRTSVISPVVDGVISGCGSYGYELSLLAGLDLYQRRSL